MRSRAEIKIKEILENYDMNFMEEFSFPDLKSSKGMVLRFDFAVFDDAGDLDFLIEYQGEQHYQPVGRYNGYAGLKRQQQNDTLKRRYCMAKGLNLIEIPFTEEKYISYDYILKKAGY